MSGLIFMVNEKVACGIHINKSYGDSLLMLKIGEENYEREINKEGTLPMDFTGRPIKGFIFVTSDGFDLEEDLSYWIDLSLVYNKTTYENNVRVLSLRPALSLYQISNMHKVMHTVPSISTYILSQARYGIPIWMHKGTIKFLII